MIDLTDRLNIREYKKNSKGYWIYKRQCRKSNASYRYT